MNWFERIAYTLIGASAVVLHVLLIIGMVVGLWIAAMPHSPLPVQCLQWLRGLL
jgi:hypothetical protein